MKLKRFSKEQLAWLKEFSPTHRAGEIVKAFNSTFCEERTADSLTHALNWYGIPFISKNWFTEEEQNWLLSINGLYDGAERYRIFCEKFNDFSRTQASVDNWCKRHNIHTRTDGRILKGTRNRNRYEIGAEAVFNGHVYVKVADEPDAQRSTSWCVGTSNNWRLKHHIIWEQAHNEKVPEDCVVLFADGNTRNFDIDNLVLMPRKYKVLMERYNKFEGKGELTKVAVKWCDLHYAIQESVSSAKS